MTGLPELGERDLAVILESPDGWGVPVVIKRVSDSFTQTLNGQVLKDSIKFSEDTGQPIVDNNPIVSLRLSTLINIPLDGEVWYFDIPESPVDGAPIKRYIFNKDNARRGFTTAGCVTYPLREYTPSAPLVTPYQQKLLDIAGTDIVCYCPMDETEGSAIVDLSGKMSDGLYVATTLAQDLSPSGTLAPQFDGITSHGEMIGSELNGLFNFDEFTISLWVKRPVSPWSPGTTIISIVMDDLLSNYIRSDLTFVSSASKYLLRSVRSGATAETTPPRISATTEWRRITLSLSKSNNRVRLFEDASLIGSVSSVPAFNGTTFTSFL